MPTRQQSVRTVLSVRSGACDGRRFSCHIAEARCRPSLAHAEPFLLCQAHLGVAKHLPLASSIVVFRCCVAVHEDHTATISRIVVTKPCTFPTCDIHQLSVRLQLPELAAIAGSNGTSALFKDQRGIICCNLALEQKHKVRIPVLPCLGRARVVLPPPTVRHISAGAEMPLWIMMVVSPWAASAMAVPPFAPRATQSQTAGNKTSDAEQSSCFIMVRVCSSAISCNQIVYRLHMHIVPLFAEAASSECFACHHYDSGTVSDLNASCSAHVGSNCSVKALISLTLH